MADLPRASPDECLAPELLIPDGKPDKQSQEQLSLNFQNKYLSKTYFLTIDVMPS